MDGCPTPAAVMRRPRSGSRGTGWPRAPILRTATTATRLLAPEPPHLNLGWLGGVEVLSRFGIDYDRLNSATPASPSRGAQGLVQFHGPLGVLPRH